MANPLTTHGDNEVRLQVTRAFSITPSDTADITEPKAALYCNGDMTLSLVFVNDIPTLVNYNESVGTGDGTTNTIGSTTLSHPPVAPWSITITDGANTIKDDGTGNLIGDGTGTIVYLTGVISLRWVSGHIPKSGVAIYCSYQYETFTGHIFKLSKGYQPMLVKRVLSTGTDLGGESLFGIV